VTLHNSFESSVSVSLDAAPNHEQTASILSSLPTIEIVLVRGGGAFVFDGRGPAKSNYPAAEFIELE